MNANNFYVAHVQILIDDKPFVMELVAGDGYSANKVKSTAEERVRKKGHKARVSSVISSTQENLSMEEFERVIRTCPDWKPYPGRD